MALDRQEKVRSTSNSIDEDRSKLAQDETEKRGQKSDLDTELETQLLHFWTQV